MATENLSQDLADLLATKNFDVKYTDEKGQDSTPSDAKVFAFDWVATSGKNYGTVVIVLGDDNDLQMFFGDNVGRTMEDPQDKLDWFGSDRHPGFLEEISRFATGHGLGTFSPKNINQLKHTMQGMAAIREGLFEGYYGTRRVSYMGEQTEARLVIRHNRMIGEDDKRYRYVESLFIETVDGERFKLPFVKLAGGRAMLEHVRQGGRPYDIRGQHIVEIVTEMSVLSRFNRASQQRVFEGVTQQLVETAQHYYTQLRENLQHMASGRGYQQYFESWTPADIGEESALVEDLKTMFIEQTLDARIEAALPTLAKIQQRGRAMKEAEIFENWANQVMEGSWALPDTPEAQAKLNELMSKELIVGPDATNATEQLYDVVGDDQLFDILSNLAEKDPRANVWDDTDVQARLQELGIQLNTTAAADQQQPVAPAAGKQAPGTAPEQGVAEGSGREMTGSARDKFISAMTPRMDNDALMQKVAKVVNSPEFDEDKILQIVGAGDKITHPVGRYIQKEFDELQYDLGRQYEDYPERVAEKLLSMLIASTKQGVAEGSDLTTMLRHAGVPVQESVLTDSTGHTMDHILKRFSKEVADFKAGGDLDNDLYDALYDYYFDDMPYGVKKARTGDPYEWVTDRLDQELGTGNHAPRLGEADPKDTFEVMNGIVNPVSETSCNMTAEGEYCPEHGLTECGYMESMGGTVAGNMAPAMEAAQDPINQNSAITGSYYESKDGDAMLARIKSLALLK